MPKFKDKSRFHLVEVLQNLGMNLAFDWVKADFSGMVKEPQKNGYSLCISDAMHQAFIELDEERTEATAATAVVMATRASIIEPDPGILFRADHPFVYCITDDVGTILFMGRMMDPK
jgi:serpin B